jgi:hypothetical protein
MTVTGNQLLYGESILAYINSCNIDIEGQVLTIQDSQKQDVDAAQLVLTSNSISIFDSQVQLVNSETVDVTGITPTVNDSQIQLVSNEAVNVTGSAITVNDSQVQAVSNEAVNVTGIAPTVNFTDNKVYEVGNEAVNVTSSTIAINDSQIQLVGSAAVSIIGSSPLTGESVRYYPSTGDVSISGVQISILDSQIQLVENANISISGYFPVVGESIFLNPASIAINIESIQPSIYNNQTQNLTNALIEVFSSVQNIAISENKIASPTSIDIEVLGAVPSIVESFNINPHYADLNIIGSSVVLDDSQVQYLQDSIIQVFGAIPIVTYSDAKELHPEAVIINISGSNLSVIENYIICPSSLSIGVNSSSPLIDLPVNTFPSYTTINVGGDGPIVTATDSITLLIGSKIIDITGSAPVVDYIPYWEAYTTEGIVTVIGASPNVYNVEPFGISVVVNGLNRLRIEGSLNSLNAKVDTNRLRETSRIMKNSS